MRHFLNFAARRQTGYQHEQAWWRERCCCCWRRCRHLRRRPSVLVPAAEAQRDLRVRARDADPRGRGRDPRLRARGHPQGARGVHRERRRRLARGAQPAGVRGPRRAHVPGAARGVDPGARVLPRGVAAAHCLRCLRLRAQGRAGADAQARAPAAQRTHQLRQVPRGAPRRLRRAHARRRPAAQA